MKIKSSYNLPIFSIHRINYDGDHDQSGRGFGVSLHFRAVNSRAAVSKLLGMFRFGPIDRQR